MRRAALTLFLAALVAGGPGCGMGNPNPRASDAGGSSGETLRVGDPAPPLAVDRWLNGEPITKLEPGKVYIVDFWATWCGPCLRAMPHLADLAEKHKAKGLVVVPVTTITATNSAAAVENYVTKNGGDFPLQFAVCDRPTMDKTWFDAADQSGIPCSFLVDKQGKIAFIGHPMEIDKPLAAALNAP